MRIAWISFDFGEYSICQANALAVEHEVLLVLSAKEWCDPRCAVHPAVRHYHSEQPRLRQLFRQFGWIRRIIREVKEYRPDVIHFQHGHLWFNLALPVLRGFPLVVTIHDPRHHEGDAESRKVPQPMMDFGYRRADRVIVHGRSHVDVVHYEIGIPRDRIHVVPHVAIGDVVLDRGASEDRNTVLFFGRIWGYKGLEYLIKAEPLITSEIPDARIVIAGKGDNFDRYRRLMEDPAHFEVHDSWVSDDERSRLFQRAAVIVLPYTSASQSGVIPVAYSHAKPVVATRVGALPEYVEHGRTGLLVPPRDERALAEAIVSLLRDSHVRHKMGEAGRKKLQEEWAPSVVARATAEVYECAIRDHIARKSSHDRRSERCNALSS